SSDEFIRFFEKRGSRDRYLLKNAIRVPITTWSILDVAVNRKGDALCYGTWKDSVFYARLSECTADNPTGVCWTELSIPSQDASMAIFSLRFSKRGHEVLCGGSDRNLHIYDLESMSRVVTIPDAHADDINAVCYGDTDSNCCNVEVMTSVKGTQVYDRRALGELDYQPVGVFAGHRDGITYIDARGDDRFLLSNSKDQTIKLWDLRRFSNEETVRKTVNCVRQQSWDYRWQPAPPCTLTPLKGDTSVITLRGHSVLHTLVRAKFSPARTGKRFIYTGCARGEVVIYDLLASSSSSSNDSTVNPVSRRLPGHVAVVRDVDWNPSCNEIATCAWDGVTAIWKWDERHDHVTSTEVNKIGAEDSCDESYQPVVKRRKAVQRRLKCSSRRKQPAQADEATESPNPELLYTF
ncbi:WD domain, G-beta repeat protein, partial [Cooperia oncophora]